MPRLLVAIAAALLVFASGSLMPNRAEASVGISASARHVAGSINIIELAQAVPERQETEYGKLRSGSNRPVPACHWERNYQTGISSWVCRTREKYDAAPRYRRVVPRH
jgi:hypothetical protein